MYCSVGDVKGIETGAVDGLVTDMVEIDFGAAIGVGVVVEVVVVVELVVEEEKEEVGATSEKAGPLLSSSLPLLERPASVAVAVAVGVAADNDFSSFFALRSRNHLRTCCNIILK